MRTIWKFPLKIVDRQTVSMPEHAQVLTVQFQDRELCLWAVVSPEARPVPRVFEILGTGHPLPEERRNYLCTAQWGVLVWHVFELV